MVTAAKVDTKTEAKIAILGKLIKLREKLVEVQFQQQEIVEEMGKLLAGGPGIGQILKDVEAHFSTCWKVRYGSDYAFNFAKDVPNLKRLIKLLGVEQLERRMLNYCRNADPFFMKARHSFGLFVTSINQHADVDEHAIGELELGLQDEVAETTKMLEGLSRPKR